MSQIQAGDYVRILNGPEAPMKVTEVGDGWVELLQGVSYRFRIETMHVRKAGSR